MTIKDKFEEMKEHHEGRKEYRGKYPCGTGDRLR